MGRFGCGDWKKFVVPGKLEEAYSSSASQNTMKSVLVIDDSPMIRKTIRRILERRDYRVLEAENGQVGFELAQRQLPDIILCDVRMPEVDGFSLLKMLRHSSATATIPFVFLTERATKQDLRQGMNLGADDYLTKPIRPAELLRALHTRLEKREILSQQAEERLNELRSNLVHSLPHELLTPLTTIVGFSNLLATRPEKFDTGRVQQMGTTIQRAARRLKRLFENYLTYAQLELLASDPQQLAAWKRQVTEQPVLIIEKTALEQAHEAQRGDDLSLALQDAPVYVGEPDLRKVVRELVNNAFKFSQPGSPVSVRAKSDSRHTILEIQDKGRGMAPEEVARIGTYIQFNRKLHEQQGSGFGLNNAKRLVELCGGALVIDSIPGQSTKVTVTLKSVP